MNEGWIEQLRSAQPAARAEKCGADQPLSQRERGDKESRNKFSKGSA
jgi:hypothetical protein